MDSVKNINDILSRLDGWRNVLTNLGVDGKDKVMSGAPLQYFLNQAEVEPYYQADDMAARIIDRPVEDMFREGFELKIVDDKDDLEAKAISELERFGIDDKMSSAYRWGRLYGGGLILIGIKDADPAEPLNLDEIREIEYFAPLDRYMLSPGTDSLVRDPASEQFGMPEFYTVEAGSKVDLGKNNKGSNIHYSRLIRFDGVKLPRGLLVKNNYWGDSVISRLRRPLANFHTAYDSAGTLMADFAQAVIKIADLDDMIAQGKEELVIKRLELIAKVNSVVNAIVIKKDEEYDRKTTNVAGLPDLLTKIAARLTSATDIPHTVLLGESASGLGATGASETRQWYDHIKGMQEKILRPAYRRILDVIFSVKSGISKGVIPEYTIEFIDLSQMTMKEQAEIRKSMADADDKYVANGILTPEEIAESRFSPEGFSVDTTLDTELRKELSEAEPEPDPKSKPEPKPEGGE